jgi:hypothetical protein
MQSTSRSFTFGRRSKNRSSRSASKRCIERRSVTDMDLGHSHSSDDKPGISASDSGDGENSMEMEYLFKLTVEHPRWTFRFGGTG